MTLFPFCYPTAAACLSSTKTQLAFILVENETYPAAAFPCLLVATTLKQRTFVNVSYPA
jgi:hypothetical protein